MLASIRARAAALFKIRSREERLRSRIDAATRKVLVLQAKLFEHLNPKRDK